MSDFRNLATALLALGLGGCAASPRFVTLSDSVEPVRSAFNAGRGRPRVVALFSPT